MKKIIKLIVFLLLILAIGIFALQKKDISKSEIIQKYTNEQSKFIVVNDLNVHYRIEGEGKPIVLIHGTGSCLQTWDVWTDSLKKYYKVIRLDMPGFGVTGPRADKNYSIDAYVKFLDNFLTKLNIDSFAIGGNSLGGQIAWNYAYFYPNKVTQLLLVDAAGFLDKNNGSKSLVFNLAKKKWIADLMKGVDSKLMVNNTLKEVYFDQSKISDNTKKMYYDMSMAPGNRQAFIDRVQTIKHDQSKDVSVLKMPTLILWGKEDLLINVAMVDSFKAIPNHKAIIYDKVGHSPQEEIPTLSVVDALLFLKNN
jgi:pimeloyl-ACP methyl ester carboxylesterase